MGREEEVYNDGFGLRCVEWKVVGNELSVELLVRVNEESLIGSV